MRGGIKIAVAEARIDDPSAMASFLAPIPNSGELAALLAKKELLNTRAYDDETQTARFVISDGNIAICFAVTDITIDQAELITIACEESNEWGRVISRSGKPHSRRTCRAGAIVASAVGRSRV
jgi:hypothetical protein